MGTLCPDVCLRNHAAACRACVLRLLLLLLLLCVLLPRLGLLRLRLRLLLLLHRMLLLLLLHRCGVLRVLLLHRRVLLLHRRVLSRHILLLLLHHLLLLLHDRRGVLLLHGSSAVLRAQAVLPVRRQAGKGRAGGGGAHALARSPPGGAFSVLVPWGK